MNLLNQDGFYCKMKNGEILIEESHSWCSIPLDQVEELHLVVHGKDYSIKRSCCLNFVEFLQYKTAICSFSGNDQCVERIIGWHDGKLEHILRINSNDGGIIGDEIKPLTGFHIHPQSKLLIKGV